VRRRLRPGDVKAASHVISHHLDPTPLRLAHSLELSVPVFLKLECWQPTGSFKVRGALNILSSLDAAACARGVAAASAGNHALGVAFAVRELAGDTRATLFVPATAPRAKISKLRRAPVELRVVGKTYDDALRAAQVYCRETGATFLHAFDDPRTAAGAGTVALEVLDQLPTVGTLLVPVGGGGLAAGMLAALKTRRPAVRLVAVQPEASPALRESLRRGEPLYEYDAGPTLCDGLAGGIGDLLFNERDELHDVVTVSEGEIADAVVALLTHDQVLAEPSGAVAVAALRSGRFVPSDKRPVVAVITGSNIDTDTLARLLSSRF